MNLPTYSGPRCQATLAVTANQALTKIAVEVQSGGYEFRLDRIVEQGAVSRIETTLIGPGDSELVTMAFETRRLEVKLPLTCTTALVLISQEKRGVNYFRKPDYALAQTLTRSR